MSASTSWCLSERFYQLPSVSASAPPLPETETTDTFRVLFASTKETPQHDDLQNEANALPSRLFIFCHGGGYSADSFTLLLEHLMRQYKTIGREEVHAIAFDARAHGKTKLGDAAAEAEAERSLSLATMRNDLCRVVLHHVQVTYGRHLTSSSSTSSSSSSLPTGLPLSLILVGHSMGGPVVVDAALHGDAFVTKHVTGVAVIDVVEGSAVEALVGMQRMVHARPTSFNSVEEAIQWSMQSHSVHSRASADVSVPAQLVACTSPSSGRPCWRWRTNLAKTAPHWEEWFKDLSTKFLAVPAAKLLILANTDRLDKPLTIAQMQGKFRMEIVTDPQGSVGHAVQEDEPEKTASILMDFADMCSAVRKVPMVGGGYKVITMGHAIA